MCMHNGADAVRPATARIEDVSGMRKISSRRIICMMVGDI